MASVVLEGLTKTYGGEGVAAVSDLDLEIADGEFLVLVGPSGCGKSTALRMIAGLEEISDGGVWINGEFVNDVHPKDRNIAMVFQNYALYPHMSVFDNMAFALQLARMPKAEIRRRVEEAARTLELSALLRRRPGQLSGGQRQRVAMGRAIVRDPAVFLMDEPLSNLDAKLRVQMRAEIAGLQRRLGVTTIYVTHDQVEAMTMGDRVAVMRDGVLQQADAPTTIYNAPRNVFVAAFIGAPSMNLVRGEVSGSDKEGLVISLGGHRLALPAQVAAERPGLAARVGQEVVVGIRPEDLHEASSRPDTPAAGGIAVTAHLVEELGADAIVHFGLEAAGFSVASSDSLDEIGQVNGGAMHCTARLSARSRVRHGDNIELVPDPERLHFFDLESGEAIR